jgi:hypothetical protein
MTTNSIRTYSKAISIPDYFERFRYLKLDGRVGVGTFDHDRYLNQVLYKSPEWRRLRRDVILRDNGCDLGHEDYEIYGKIVIHHLNPITVEDVLNRDPKIFDLENVISCSLMTHNAIHYGDENLLMGGPINRSPNDTCPWRRT